MQNESLESMSRYNVRRYELSDSFIGDVMKLDSRRSDLAVASTWATLIALVLGMRYLLGQSYGWYFYIPGIFLIAGRQGALLQLVHEAAHGLLSESRALNHAIGQYLCAMPVGISLDGYGSGHIRHHSYTGTEDDPLSDREKYRVTDVRDPKLYLLFLKDLFGITALSMFFAYGNNEGEIAKKKTGVEFRALALQFSRLCLVQLVVLGGLFQFHIPQYILLWLIPAMSPHMFLMRIRGIAEHGLPRQLGKHVDNSGVGTFYTRSFMTPARHYAFTPLIWLERALIGSHRVYFHHEHHLLPKVPFYNLEKVHMAIKDRAIQYNPDIYVRGYFTAALKSVLEKP